MCASVFDEQSRTLKKAKKSIDRVRKFEHKVENDGGKTKEKSENRPTRSTDIIRSDGDGGGGAPLNQANVLDANKVRTKRANSKRRTRMFQWKTRTNRKQEEQREGRWSTIKIVGGFFVLANFNGKANEHRKQSPTWMEIEKLRTWIRRSKQPKVRVGVKRNRGKTIRGARKMTWAKTDEKLKAIKSGKWAECQCEEQR